VKGRYRFVHHAIHGWREKAQRDRSLHFHESPPS
jgi:hypothetical protein